MSSNNAIDSDIQRLTLEVNERKERTEKWDTVNIRFIFLAGFVAVCLGITAIGVSKSNGALVRSSEELSDAKDSKLALDLKTKDGEIAHAQQLAGTANRRAEELAKENLEIKGTINRSVADTLLREEELKAKNLATESKLEEERSTRLELEKSLAPRILSFTTGGGGKNSLNRLRPLAGMGIIIESIPDFEARRTADDIAGVLEAAGVRIVDRIVSSKPIMDGVTVETYMAPLRERPATPEEGMTDAGDWMRSGDKAQLIIDFLSDQDWAVMPGWSDHGELKKDMLKIAVGFKPSPYFQSPEIKKALKKMEEMRQRFRQSPPEK